MKILLISDIHANFPALLAIEKRFSPASFDAVINAGDSLVYGPFPHETLDWLRTRSAQSILGNTDKKVLQLLAGKTMKKPSKHEKRIMYTWTADQLNSCDIASLRSLPTSLLLDSTPKAWIGTQGPLIGVFHGSPANDDEFVFPGTPMERLGELEQLTTAGIIIVGHSHTPFHRTTRRGTHFINPGSAGRMFDGDPRASCAVLSFTAGDIQVEHFRIPYSIQEVVDGLEKNNLPEIYGEMFLAGRKLN
jgi:predicted phosphodiesterase